MTARGIIVSFAGALLLLVMLPWLLIDVDMSAANSPYTTTPTLLLEHVSPEQVPIFSREAQTAIYCSVEVTTTDSAPTGNYSLATAATVANYIDQSLLDAVDPVPPTSTASIPVRSDFYRLDNALVNYKYSIEAVPDRTINYNLGIIVYNRDQQAVYTDTDTSSNRASITFEAFNAGPYYIEIFQVSAQCSGGTYELIYRSPVPPTATPTSPAPTSTPTPRPPVPQPTERPPSGFDQYEPNFDFNTSTLIAPDVTYSLNFVPWGTWSNDNDFFRLWVKPGLRYACETSELAPGVDPNMIFYSAPNFESAIASNDDVALGDFNSRVSYYSTYEGYLYILVGQGERMKPQDTANSSYKLRCTLTVPGASSTPGASGHTPAPDKSPPTAAPTARPTATPRPQTSPIATPDPPTETPTPESAELTIRLIATPEPTMPTPTPTGFRTFRVLVYFDENQDGQAGAGEGIPGFFIRALSPERGEELARGYTDEQGQLSFTVPTVGTVRVVVPLLGLDRMIETAKPEVNIRIVPPTLPDAIP